MTDRQNIHPEQPVNEGDLIGAQEKGLTSAQRNAMDRMDLIAALSALSIEQKAEKVSGMGGAYNPHVLSLTKRFGLRESDGVVRTVDEEITYQRQSLEAQEALTVPFSFPGSTPRPWRKEVHLPDPSSVNIVAKAGYDVLTVWGNEANAAFVLQAVNSHDALVAAITSCQAKLAAWIVPDSGIADKDVIDDLLGILDHRDLVKLVQS